jgi:hypothetical protein
VSDHTPTLPLPRLAIIVPLILPGVFRYACLVRTRQVGERPTDAPWTGVPLIPAILGWGAPCVYALLPGQ